MRVVLRIIAVWTLFGAFLGVVFLPSLFESAFEDGTTALIFVAQLAGTSLSLPGAIQLWRLRRSGRLLVTISVSIFLAISLASIAVGMGHPQAGRRIIPEVAILLVLLSPSAKSAVSAGVENEDHRAA